MPDINELLAIVKEKNASDLHCGEGYRPFLRIHGDLRSYDESEILTQKDVREIAEKLVSKEHMFRLTAKNDVDFAFTHNRATRFRVHAYHVQGKLNFTHRRRCSQFNQGK